MDINSLVSVFDGDISLSVVSIDDSYAVHYQQSRVMRIASLGKLFIFGTLLEKCSLGQACLEDRILVTKEVYVGGSGILPYLQEGHYFALRELATLMMIVSDNTATNLVLGAIGGASEVKKHLASFGIVRSGVNRRIAMTEEDMAMGCFAAACTEDIVRYLKILESGKIVEGELLSFYHRVMEDQQFKNMFLRYLPLKENYEETLAGELYLSAGSKTGYDADQRSDAGFIRFEDGRVFLYALIANNGSDTRYCVDNEAQVLMAKIGKAFYEEVSHQQGVSCTKIPL